MKKFAMLALFFIQSVFASINLYPTQINLSFSQPRGNIEINNTGSEPVLLQAEGYAWTQSDGKDVLTPTKSLILSPRVLKIPAKGSQIMRLGLQNKSASTNEQSYRLILKEIKSQLESDSYKPNIELRLQFNLPVFIEPQGKPAANPKWSIKKHENLYEVELHNAGNKHLFLSDLILLGRNNNIVFQKSAQFQYLLANEKLSFLIPSDQVKGEPHTLKALIDGKYQDQVIDLAATN